ncbi:MAG: peptidylprolyl isomerase [Bacteroidota bacterium]|nr:peptidylprolyl isomerase [Bacteroidota bacterium]
MKKLVFLFLCSLLVSSGFCQTLFTYGKHAISADEFIRAYNKNKTANSDNDQALRDYLNLYINFKLKVQEAKDQHLDTLPSLEADLQNFRSQIEGNYLKDDKEVKALDNEAFTRSQKDIHVLHFFIALPDQATPADTAKYYQAISEVDRQLKLNDSPENILKNVNKDGISVQENDLGFVTVFTLPYEFENIVYGLKQGQVGNSYRTKKGWHIFKNLEERHAFGKIKIAQILFAVPAGFIAPRAQTKKLADSVYNLLINGGDFAELAKIYSTDRMTYMDGGIMPEFGVAKYKPDFEKMAFSLTHDGEISKPFETEFGYHIIKRIAATPVPPDQNDDNFMADLKQKVSNDSRIEIAKQKFVTEILPKIGFKEYKVNKENLWKVTDSSLLGNKNITAGNVNEKTNLFSYNNNAKVKVSDWILYLRNTNHAQAGAMHESYKQLFPGFISASAVENYRNRLQDFNAAFKNQINEFKEGNMLFEIMQRQVWGKASADSTGLREYYNLHKDKYWWKPSADAIIFSCANENVAKSSMEQINKGKSWKDIMNENASQVQADSGRFELTQIPVNEKIDFSPELITSPVINKTGGTAVFTQILKLYPNHQQRNFEDARGLVISDYQNFLEEKWIEKLKKQYPVKVDEKVFKALLK